MTGTSRPLSEVPRDGTPFDVLTTHTFRWLPYKTKELRQRTEHAHEVNGVLGRWQYLNERGMWINTAAPQGLWMS
jgi:hypothetical protein